MKTGHIVRFTTAVVSSFGSTVHAGTRAQIVRVVGAGSFEVKIADSRFPDLSGRHLFVPKSTILATRPGRPRKGILT